MTHASDIHQLINVLATAPIGAPKPASAAKTGATGFKAVIKEGLKPASNFAQLAKKHPKITFNRISKYALSQPPADVVKGLDDWITSIEGKPGFGLLENITLEADFEGAHPSEKHLTVGENIFQKGEKYSSSILSHEFEHVRDIDLKKRHLISLLSTKTPAEIKDILSNKNTVLLHHHYEKVLDMTVEQLKGDQEFKVLLTSVMRQTKDAKAHEAIDIFLSKEPNKQSLSGLAHVLFNKKERLSIDKYLRMNYGIPGLYSFVAKKSNLRRIDPRLAEINGNPHLIIHPELSATFAELSTQELKEMARLGTKTASDTVATLMQIAYDAGKVTEEEFMNVTRTVPGPKIYTGPTLLS